MTYRTFLSSRSQVAAMLALGVYLTIASRSHFNQMVVDVTGKDNSHVYSTMNVLYQVAYATVQIPASVYADRVDPATVLGAVPLTMAFSSAVAPFALPELSSAAQPLSAAAIVTGALFAVNGAVAGSWWPFMNVILTNWAPPAELAYMYAAINTGIPGGIALGNAFTGFAYGVHGTAFRYSFFVVSVVCVLWSVTWLFKFQSRPENDPGIRQKELDYLNTNIRPKRKLSSAPWREIATSLPVWSMLLANFGSTVFYTVLIMYMPVYLKNTVKTDVSRNGFMSALPSLGQIIVMYMIGCCASFMQTKRYMDVTNIRKVFTFVGMVVPSCVILIAPIFKDHYAFYGLLVLAYAVSGSVFSGFRVSQMELAPNFVAAITAVGDLVGSLAMNVTHVAFMVSFGDITEQITWNRICLYLSAMLVVCAGPFMLYGSSEVQSWNDVSTTAEDIDVG